MISGEKRLGVAPSTVDDCLPAPAWAYMLRCADGSLYSGWTSDCLLYTSDAADEL